GKQGGPDARSSPPSAQSPVHGPGAPPHPSRHRDRAVPPEPASAVPGGPGRPRPRPPACNGPISVADARAAQTDVDNLRAALAAVKAEDVFMSAASPGVISLFFRNDHYPNHEAYLFAIAEAMKPEYATVARAGIVLQIDCPDLGMGRHIQYAHLGLEEFRKMAQLHIEALNHALANVP